MNDISPDFVWNKRDSKIISRLIALDKKPEAIVEFSKVCDQLTDYTYWFVLGTLWVSYTGWSDLNLWKRLFQSKRPRRETSLMKPSELRFMRALPHAIPAYRAHHPNETDWLSYTISQEKAGMFAAKRGVERVSKYVIPKPSVVALFTRRGESEVLVLDRTNVQKICDVPVLYDPALYATK